nr:restriction endonuclease subunit S [Pseudoalteromonas arctica]
MFGDPITNPKGWNISYLPNHGSLKNGLNFAKGESGNTLKYLGVGNFKSWDFISNLEPLGTVELDEVPTDDYLIQSGDIVFVRSNGNKALVGRCLTVYPKKVPLTFSGFCIRYRVEDSNVEPEYLSYLFKTSSMKQALLQGGQGANIQNINQKILSSIAIPLPPIEKQKLFCKLINMHRKNLKKATDKSLEHESLFQSLMQRAFRGELELKNVA